MADGILSKAIDALTTKKGAVIAGVAILGLAALNNISQQNAQPAPAAAPQIASAIAQTTAPADKSGTFSPDQVKALHGIIKSYLVQNPEVMVEVTKELERRQQAEQAAEQARVIGANKAKIFSQAADFVAGNAKGDITVVEFFDYNCGWCKRSLDDINALTKSDSKVRVVLKELPIFGEASTLAAKAAMASIRQNKYWEMHSALMREKQVSKDNLFQIAERVGLNVTKLKADMADPKHDATLKENSDLAQALNIEGTPGFIIDGRVNVGYMQADAMRQMIADIRKTGCKMC